jgi:hypothetical protein
MPVKLMQTWKDKHPDYQFILWDNAKVAGRKWVCQKQLDQMLSIGRYNGAADIIRYEVLHEFGGFVAPADSVCLNPIDDLLDLGFFCCYESEQVRPGLLSPHIGTYPENPVIESLIFHISLIENVLSDEAWIITGNKMFTAAVNYLKPEITILPSHTFIPDHYKGVVYQGNEKVYARHIWGTTLGLNNDLDKQI